MIIIRTKKFNQIEQIQSPNPDNKNNLYKKTIGIGAATGLMLSPMLSVPSSIINKQKGKELAKTVLKHGATGSLLGTGLGAGLVLADKAGKFDLKRLDEYNQKKNMKNY